MVKVTYEKQLTALLVIDPYNDFISEGGKVWGRLKAVADANGCVPHMLQVLNEDAYRPPETWARRAYRNVIYFHEVDKGGHFAAWEQPELFAAELRAALVSLR
jgi:pimeloyl-ACP methyl ester carboxylesterase